MNLTDKDIQTIKEIAQYDIDHFVVIPPPIGLEGQKAVTTLTSEAIIALCNMVEGKV